MHVTFLIMMESKVVVQSRSTTKVSDRLPDLVLDVVRIQYYLNNAHTPKYGNITNQCTIEVDNFVLSLNNPSPRSCYKSLILIEVYVTYTSWRDQTRGTTVW